MADAHGAGGGVTFAPETGAAPERAGARILVVDDTEANRYTVARYLRDAGYRVVESASGAEALALATHPPVDLVVLDIRMPDLDGYEVARRLRANARTARLPIIHLSASFTDPASQAAGLENGADGFLTHPIEPPVLIASVRALLRARAAEVTARAAEEAWRTTFEAIADGVCVIDSGGRIERWNSAFATLVRPARVAGGMALDTLIPGVRTISEAPFVALTEGPASPAVDLPLGDRWVRISARAIDEAAGAPARAVCVVADATRQRAAELRAQQTQRLDASAQLAGGTAHEINNMMTVVIGFADFLLHAPDLAPAHRRDLEEVRRAASRAADVARQLLAFSRRQLLRPSRLDLNGTLTRMGRLLQQLMGGDHEVILTLSPDAGFVLADEAQLEQAVVNLALNARHAMRRSGSFTIATSRVDLGREFAMVHPGVELRPGRYARISVEDTGEGMDPATLDRIFEPFFTTKNVGEGTGLGLASVYGIIKQSNGYIWASSEPGQGTTFEIYLPSAAEFPAATEDDSAASPLAGGQGTILVADDEPLVRALARRALEPQGYTVLEAANGREALELMGRDGAAVALVVADIVMPVLNGRELGERLRAGYPEVPILYVSGHTGTEIARRELLSANAEYLQKPFSPAELVARVQRQLAAREGAPRRAT